MIGAATRLLTLPKSSATPAPQPAAGTVVFQVPFDGPNGSSTFTDLAGHTLTASGGVVQNNGAAVFDGVDDHVSTGAAANLALGTGNFTIEGFASVTGPVTGAHGMIGNAGGNDGNVTFLARLYNNKIQFTGWTSTWATGVTDIPQNRLFHWAVTRKDNTLYLALDGKIDAVANVAALNLSATNGYRIGWDGDTRFAGTLAEVRVCKDALYTKEYIPPSLPLPTTI